MMIPPLTAVMRRVGGWVRKRVGWGVGGSWRRVATGGGCKGLTEGVPFYLVLRKTNSMNFPGAFSVKVTQMGRAGWQLSQQHDSPTGNFWQSGC